MEEDATFGIEGQEEEAGINGDWAEAQFSGTADAGILESLRLENFMSHHLFEFHFGPSVNIINGQNGSGKTAVVTGLQICLGAKTSSTDRGKSLASYIKHNASYGVVTVRIRNRRSGILDDRYKPEDYGDAVVIERRLVQSGTGGGWTFRDGENRKVKLADRTPREELNAILDHFNIQVDNPIAVLTQQKGKQFLSSKKETDMYKFFMEATCLEQVKSELLAISKVRNDISEILEKKKSLVQQVRDEVQRLARRYEEAKEMSTMESRIDEMESLWAWTLVAEQEEEIEKHKNNLEAVEVRLARYREDLGNADSEVSESRDAVQSLNEKMTQLTSQIRAHAQLMSSFNDQLKSVKQQLSSAQKENSAHEASLQDSARKAAKLEDELRKARQQHEKGNSQVDDWEKALAEKKSEKRAAEANVASVQESIRKQSEEMHKLRSEVNMVQQEVSKYKLLASRALEEANQYRRAEQNSLLQWGRHVPELEKKIDAAFREGKFRKRPVGPIGAFVTVKDDKWARAIQHCLQGLLSSYIVDNSQDRKALRSLMGRDQYMSIIQTAFEDKYDIPESAKVPPGLLSILDAITVESSPVFNVLIDHGEIERQVLTDSRGEADRLAEMERGTIRKCWLPDGSQVYSRNSALVYRSGDKHLPVLLTRDMNDAIDALMSRHSENTTQAEEMTEKKRELERKRVRASDAESKLAETLRNTNSTIASLETEIHNLESKLEGATTRFDSSGYDALLEQCSKDATEHETSKADVERRIASLNERINQINERKARDAAGGLEVDEEMNKLRSDLDEATERYKKSLAAHTQKQRKIDKVEEAKARAEAQLEQEEAKVAKEIEDAEKFAPERIHRGTKNAAQLEKEIKSLKTKLQAEQDRHSGQSLLQIQKEFYEAKERKAKTDGDMRNMEDHLNRVQTGFSLRRKKYLKMRRMTKYMTNLHFKYFMQKRNNIGELIFDDKGGENEEGTMRFRVSMHNHKKKNGGHYEMTDMSSLSGGERNFTTLAFMLALGESMNIPVRIMDEFDVFMDEYHRRASYEVLIEVTDDMPGRQFIFVTPLQLPNIKSSTRVKIQKLLPPERGGARQQRIQEFAAA